MANPSRSMGRFKGYCADRAKDLNEFLSALEDHEPTAKEVLRLEELCTLAKDQFERMHTKWEALADDITDDTVYKKCEEDYEQSKDTSPGKSKLPKPSFRKLQRRSVGHLNRTRVAAPR